MEEVAKMDKKWAVLLAVSLSMGLGACSSGQTEGEEGEMPADEFPVADAGTDAVPAASAEQPPGDGAAEAPSAESQALGSMADSGPPVAGSGQYDNYTVQDGDTLMKIAFETYGDLYQWRRIYESNKNKISNPNAVPKGTVLSVEKPATPVNIERNGERYLIKPGDTLGTISQDVYGTKRKWKKLWENNKQLIRDPNRIFAGFHLYYIMTPEDQSEKGTPPLAGPGGGGTNVAPIGDPNRDPAANAQ
jgi:nucleoid-associated protein YgaU